MNDNTKDEFKQCSKCGIIKPATSHHFEKSNKEGALRNRCLDCGKEYRRNYYKKYNEVNEEYVKERNREYGRTYYVKKIEENPEEHREKNRIKANKRYHRKNEEIRKYNRDRYMDNKEIFLERSKTYRDNNRKRVRFVRKVAKYKRRSIMEVLPSTLTSVQWDDCKVYFGSKCAYCGINEDVTMDHFIPISDMGGTTKENIVPACRSCNSSKSNRKFSKWYPERPFYDEKRESKVLKWTGLKLIENEIQMQLF